MPRMILLQGPPGTGKTHTIVGLVKRFFEVRYIHKVLAEIRRFAE